MSLAGLHFDLDPGELALATLLSNAGELELWAFAAELPQAARDELASGRAQRSDQAQLQACGFSFKNLTLLLIEHWNLPPLIRQLIRGDEGQRAQLARLSRDMARHISHSHRDTALPDDVRIAARLTHARPETVIQALPRLDEADKAALTQAMNAPRKTMIATNRVPVIPFSAITLWIIQVNRPNSLSTPTVTIMPTRNRITSSWHSSMKVGSVRTLAPIRAPMPTNAMARRNCQNNNVDMMMTRKIVTEITCSVFDEADMDWDASTTTSWTWASVFAVKRDVDVQLLWYEPTVVLARQ